MSLKRLKAEPFLMTNVIYVQPPNKKYKEDIIKLYSPVINFDIYWPRNNYVYYDARQDYFWWIKRSKAKEFNALVNTYAIHYPDDEVQPKYQIVVDFFKDAHDGPSDPDISICFRDNIVTIAVTTYVHMYNEFSTKTRNVPLATGINLDKISNADLIDYIVTDILD